MLNDDESESPEICRERRRRRIELRRVAAAAAAASVRRVRSSENMTSTSGGGDDVALPLEARAAQPVFGTLSIPGRSRIMEDAVSVWTEFAHPEITRQRGVHFLAVYDGHGGSHVVELCKERMHEILSEEMGQLRFTRGGESGDGGEREAEEEEWWWRRVMKRSFARMDYEAMNTCTRCGSVGCKCGCQLVSVGGSTAAVVVLTPDHIVVANVGDSRTVLRRDGIAVALSHDHKPDRSDERARIEAAGGCVLFVNGARVEGILAMSRAIGDKHLKLYVISEPEVTFTKRVREDECLIIASDGMWDVLSSDLACRVAGECLREGIVTNPATVMGPQTAGTQREDERPGALYPSRSALTAAILTRLALGQKSSDNISVVVVDLKRS